MKLKYVLILALQMLTALPASSVFAAASSNAAVPAAPAQGSQAVFVVAPQDLPKQNAGVQIDTPRQAAIEKSDKPEVRIQIWSGPVPLAGGLWILVASMPVLASLYFAYQLFMFIKARRRRLSIKHGN